MLTDTQAVEEVVALVGDVLLTVCSTDVELLIVEDDAIDVLFALKPLGWPDFNV